jgi:type-F conjugative transfer system pilin assembly protein TrbC
MKKKLQVIIIFIFIIESISYVSAGEFGISNVSSAIDEAEKLQADIQLKKTDNPKAEEAAKKAAEYFHSEECQSRISAESERIKKDLFQEYVKDEHSQKSRGLLETERIYIFISSSMPIATLKTYALEIEQIGDKNITMVMRGFVGGMAKFGPTMEFCQKVLMLDPDCNVNDCEAIRAQIEIDPNLFRKFGIKEVPAIVYAKNVNLIDPEQSAGVESNTKGNISGYRLYGAVPIDYALDKFYQESKSNNLKMLLSRARGSRE